MQKDSGNIITYGEYDLYNFNSHLNEIQMNILDYLYSSDQLSKANLRNISQQFIYEAISIILKKETLGHIYTFSKIEDAPLFDFCTIIDFENFYFQKASVIGSLIPVKIAINRYNTFNGLRSYPKADIESMITQHKHNNLNKLHKFLKRNNMTSLSNRIKMDINLKRRLFGN